MDVKRKKGRKIGTWKRKSEFKYHCFNTFPGIPQHGSDRARTGQDIGSAGWDRLGTPGHGVYGGGLSYMLWVTSYYTFSEEGVRRGGRKG
ncbi:hypothetical protein VTJ04DRAFT_9301 [Mycothermus thermophilus]|uniref:uncharacterized protein n=1 Tax=Humicola insolens TaxID=85995 RepID=UPI003742B833